MLYYSSTQLYHIFASGEQERMHDVVSCVSQGDEEEEETDNLVNQVLDEIGINLDEQMVAAPGQKVQARSHISSCHGLHGQMKGKFAGP